jgi:hypothetical protein
LEFKHLLEAKLCRRETAVLCAGPRRGGRRAMAGRTQDCTPAGNAAKNSIAAGGPANST